MKKRITFCVLPALLVCVGALAADISHTPLAPGPLRLTDKIPMGRPSLGLADGKGSAYTLSLQQLLDFVKENYVVSGGTAGPSWAEINAALNSKQNLLTYTPENPSRKGVPGGYASLDGTGKVPVEQLPSASGQAIEASSVLTDSTHQFVTNGEKNTWDAKQTALIAGTDYVTPMGSGEGLTGLNASNLATGTVSSARGGAGNVNGVLKADGAGSVTAAVAGTDYLAPGGNGSQLTGLNASNIASGTVPASRGGAGTVNGIMKADGAGSVMAAVAGTDYLAPTGSAANLTGFPTLNQNTSGNAATATKLATPRTINGVAFDGTANITVADSTKAPIASPTFTGTVTIPILSTGAITSSAADGAHYVECSNTTDPPSTGAGPGRFCYNSTSGKFRYWTGSAWADMGGSWPSTAGTLPDNTIATTQAANDNSTKVATTAYVDRPVKIATGTSGTLTGPRQYFVCTGTCTVTVPVPVAGYEFCVYNDTGISTAITLSALGSSAMYEKADHTAYGTAGTGTLALSAAAGNKVCLVGRDATHYHTISYTGTVTVN